jgi:hypothetical protein
MPLYEVTAGAPGDGVKPRLINARTKTGARSFAAKDTIHVELVSPLRAAVLVQRGSKIEDAIDDNPTE